MRSAAVTSELKSTCPGESIRLTCSVGQQKAQPSHSCPAQGLMLQLLVPASRLHDRGATMLPLYLFGAV